MESSFLAILALWIGSAAAYTGGPIRADLLGYDPTDAKVFFVERILDESAPPPRIFYFDLDSASPHRAIHAASLDRGGQGLENRLVPLVASRGFRIEVVQNAESVGVDSRWPERTRFRVRVALDAGGARTDLLLDAYCMPTVAVRGLYAIPGRKETLAVVSYVGRAYGCEEVERPVILPGP